MRTRFCVVLALAMAAGMLGGCSHERLAGLLPAPPVAPGTDSTEWFLRRRVPPGMTELPRDVMARAREHIANMPVYAAASGATHPWTSLGPGNIGARTRSLAIHPQNPDIMYAGAVTGGVFKTTDGGATWANLTDGLPVINIGALVLDPSNPNTVYAGTGESWSLLGGTGIFKSADGGATWNLLGTPPQAGAFTYINRIAVSPKNPQHLYAATRTGLYASKDGGATWQTSGINASYYGCTDLVIRPDTATDYLFAVCSGATAAQTAAVWRNTDAGGAGTWTSVFTTAGMSTSVIALAPSQTSTIYLAAAAALPNVLPRDTGGLVGVFRSTANGDPGTWTTQVSGSDPDPFNVLLFAAAHSNTTTWCSAGGPYTGSTAGTWSRLLAVDPLDPNRVWVGGVDLYRSDDGGVTWGVASAWDLGALPSFSHADRHLMVFHPNYDGARNQTAFQVNDGGIWRTDNARAAVSTGLQAGCQPYYQNNNQLVWKHLDNSYVGTEFYHGAAYPGGNVYFGGTQDNGVNRGSDAGGINGWIQMIGGDGGAVAVDPADVNHLFNEDQFLSLRRSVDGFTFVAATTGITESSSTFPFEAHLATDPNDGRRAFLGGTTNLWRSLDQGVSWTAAAPVESGGAVSAITVSPFDSNTVLFGSSQGYIYRSSSALSTGGTTPWTSVRPRTGNVASITFDTSNPNLLYATYSTLKSSPSQAHVYRSTDGGQTWSPSDGSGSTAVPDIPSWRLLADPRTPGTLYLGTDLGLLVSTDSGATWSHDAGLPPVVIEDLGFEASNSWLFAYTYGRGIFKTPLAGAGGFNCTYSVNPATISADRFGGTVPVAVSAPSGCGWVAYPNAASSFASIQSPAQGSGNGTAYVTIQPNISSGALSANFTIAGTAVAVSQAGQAFQNISADAAASAPAITVPAMIRVDTRGDTSAADDPVHSCTGSADFKTVWWKVTPASSGYLSVVVRGDRLDMFGDFGIVVTAYPQTNPAQELGCATVPKNNNGRTTTAIGFNATAGATYLIEVATSGGNTAQDGGNATLILTAGTPPVAVTVSPATATLQPGGSARQFAAQVANAGNTGVRWTVTPPIGIISTSGMYTPPASLSGSTTVTVTAASFADPTKTGSATVTLQSSPIQLTAAGVVNAASFKGGAVAPGEIVTIFGSGFGPAALAGLSLTAAGAVSTTAGGTQVLFDGVAAPMIYAVAGQISAVVPYEVASKSTTQVQVSYSGALSAATPVAVTGAAPGLFLDSSGTGQLAMLNHDGGVNSPSNPESRGNYVVIFGTGEGQTTPAGVDGQLLPAVSSPVLTPSVTIGGISANVLYFGGAPGLVDGVFQVDAVIPDGVTPGPAVPVTVTVGTAPSATGTTMAVK